MTPWCRSAADGEHRLGDSSAADRALWLWEKMRWSTGPFLEITAEDVGPLRNRAVLGYIESWMLLPDDPAKRGHAIEATAAEAVTEMMADRVSRELALELRRAPQIPPFDAELK